MPDVEAKRTLVKSPPELWEELSEVERLARHLGAFGEIRITKLEPEHTVAWEGEHGSGTVSIEPSGWGTKVRLTAALAAPEPAALQEVATTPPAPPRRRGFWARLAARWFGPRTDPLPPAPPAVEEPPAAPPPKPALDPGRAQGVLDETLQTLGSAHHRPFSRA